MRQIILAVITLLSIGLSSTKNYNILSLDSAKYAGLMTADFVSYLEQRSYSIARREKSKYCYPKNTEERIHMNELFDMIAGSETGAIIASTLAQAKDGSSTEPKYYVDTAGDFFKANVDLMYVDGELSAGVAFVVYFFGLLIMGIIAYQAAQYYFSEP